MTIRRRERAANVSGCRQDITDGGPPEIDRRRATDVGDVSQIDIGSCIPVAARAHVMLQKSEPEHRTITAAFIDMMDIDQLLAEVGPDELAFGLDARISSIQEAALRYEVPFYETDVGKSSIKALLTAGAPSSTGRDEERMLRTLREVMDRPGLVPMRVGVNTGKVFTGDFGPPYRRAYRVFGDAINTAARVMSKAEAGQILATDVVLGLSRTIFEATPIAPFAAKGKSEPLRASIVGQPIGLKQADRGQLALVGRETELATILGVLDQVRFGTAWTIEIAGEAGVGKSRLIDEVAGRALDFRVVRSRCEEYERSTPYFPMRAIMRAVIGLDGEADAGSDRIADALDTAVSGADPALAKWTPLIGLLLGIDLPHTRETRALEGRFVPERLAEVTNTFLAMALTTTPVMLVLEDAHHMDEASRDLIERLARADGAGRRVLIVTRQSDSPIAGDPAEADRFDRPRARTPGTGTDGGADQPRDRGRSAPSPRHRGDRPSVGGQHAVPVRAPPGSPGDRVDRVAARFDRVPDRR